MVDIALGVIEIVAGLGIGPAHRTHHLGREQDIVDRHDLGEQIDTGLVVDAGVEPHIVLHHLIERRPLVVERKTAIAPPMEWRRAAAVGNDQLQGREILEQVAHDQLHERRGIGVDVVRAGAMKGGIARRAHMDHRRDVKLDHLLIEFVPPAVGKRRRRPVAAGRIGIEIASDEAELVDTALELLDAAVWGHPRRLRQLAHPDEIVGIERAHAMNHLVAQLRPGEADLEISDMVTHAHGARGEDGQIRAALALELELRPFEAFADLVIAHLERGLGRLLWGILEILHLLLAPAQEVLRFGRVVAVTINDHDTVAGIRGTRAGAPAHCECYEPGLRIVKRALLRGRQRRRESSFHNPELW